MWFLRQEPCKTLDQARKRAMEIGRENFDSIHKEHYGLLFKRTAYVILWWKWIDERRGKWQEIGIQGFVTVVVKMSQQVTGTLRDTEVVGESNV